MRPPAGARTAFSVVVVAASMALVGTRTHAMGSRVRIDPSGTYFDRGFALATIWDDGRAEVSRYTGRETRYGVARDAEWTVILVKERHRPGAWVKSADPNLPNLVDVLKLDEVLTVPTGVSSQRQMLTTIFARQNLQDVRTTMTSQDWLGQTWKELIRPDAGAAILRYATYGDGEARGRRELAADRGVVLFDDLVLLLRTLRSDAPGAFSLEVLPTLVSSRVGDLRSEAARIETHRGETLRVAGTTWHARRTDVHRRAGVDSFWFDEDGAAPLLRWRKQDGTVWSLVETARIAYWRWNHPGDTMAAAVTSERAEPISSSPVLR